MFANDAVKTVVDSDSGLRARERARSGAEHQVEQAKGAVARAVMDMAEEYFPEEAKSRRRRSVRRAFVLGLAVGLFLAALLGGRR